MSRKSRLKEKAIRQVKGTNIGDPNNPIGQSKPREAAERRAERDRTKNRR